MAKITLNIYRLSFSMLASFAETIYKGFVDMVADYPGPNPTMPVFRLHINALNSAITKWGGKKNYGGRVAHDALVSAAKVVRDDLIILSAYAMNCKPNNPDSWRKLGFPIRRPKSASQPLEMVRDLHQFIARNIVAPSIRLKWKKPLNTQSNLVKGYIIQWNTKNEYPYDYKNNRLMNVAMVVTDTSYIDTNPKYGENWYWVTPFNSVGLGVTSDALLVISNRVEE